jgi:hypothetical protein
VLARVPTGRLVVLGEPGAGKTMLMIRLVLDLLNGRQSGEPVPVLASLASWDPGAGQDLHAWLAAQMTTDYPSLVASAPDGTGGSTSAAALLSAGLILPILDGLDEIPGSGRGQAINQIKGALRPGERLIVTCRTEPYREAIQPQRGAGVSLWAAAVELCPLTAADAAEYLRAGGAGSEDRWQPVLEALGTESPVGQALTTPLMLGMARTIYYPGPGEDLPNPGHLCDLADRAEVESYLFDGFVPAAYKSDPPGRRTARKAERWLAFLAGHLELTIGSPGLAWWQLQYAVPPPSIGFRVGLAAFAGLTIAGGIGAVLGLGLTFLSTGVIVGMSLMVGLVFGATPLATVRTPSRGMQFNIRGSVIGAAVGASPGVVLLPFLGVSTGLKLIAGLAAAGGLLGALRRVPGDLTLAATPSRVLAHDRRAALVLGVVSGLAVMIWTAIALSAQPGSTRFRFLLAVGIGVGLGLSASASQAAWLPYVLARWWLALHKRLPWRLTKFLTDAHHRGVLRQAGAVYQFRHINLQRRLSRRAEPSEHPQSRWGPISADGVWELERQQVK